MKLVDISFPQDQAFAFLTLSGKMTPGIIKTLNLKGQPVLTTWRDSVLPVLGGTSSEEFSIGTIPLNDKSQLFMFRHRDAPKDSPIILDGESTIES